MIAACGGSLHGSCAERCIFDNKILLKKMTKSLIGFFEVVCLSSVRLNLAITQDNGA